MKKILPCIVLVLVFYGMEAQEGLGRNTPVNTEELDTIQKIKAIRESSRNNRDQRLIVLGYIGNLLERGSTNEEIRLTLEYLSLEGTQNKARENGRLVNDYPEVRREAARYLGIMGTTEAKRALIRICNIETDPTVLQEAVKSLGDIGMNDNDETVNTIVWVADKFDRTTVPNNLLALSAIDALDRIAAKNNGLTNPNAYTLLIRISEGSYRLDVRERARQILINFREYMGMR